MATPSELKLIIATCKTHLNCNINLVLLAKRLPIDDVIIGKKLLGIIAKGQVKMKVKKTHTKKSTPIKKTARKDFSNQCTVIVQISPDKKINLKIFGNGNVVITGGLSREDGIIAVDILLNKIKNLTDVYRITPDTQFSDYFDSMTSYIKYIGKNYIIFLKLFSIYNININLMIDTVLNKKTIEKFSTDNDVCDPVGKGVIECATINNDNTGENSGTDDPTDIEKYLRMIQIFNICHSYFPSDIFLQNLSQPDHKIYDIINRLYEMKDIELPITFDQNLFDGKFEVTVENYNTMFNTGFQCNREIFTQILNNKYKKNGMISSAKFEPSTYQGINVKYVSRAKCDKDCTSNGNKKHMKCMCKEISFLIFQEGNVIITGGRHWEQLVDGYNTLVNIMKAEYNEIVVEKHKNVIGSDFPAQINRQNIVYINKQKQIFENPRNMFLLKKNGLLDLYR